MPSIFGWKHTRTRAHTHARFYFKGFVDLFQLTTFSYEERERKEATGGARVAHLPVRARAVVSGKTLASFSPTAERWQHMRRTPLLTARFPSRAAAWLDDNDVAPVLVNSLSVKS